MQLKTKAGVLGKLPPMHMLQVTSTAQQGQATADCLCDQRSRPHVKRKSCLKAYQSGLSLVLVPFEQKDPAALASKMKAEADVALSEIETQAKTLENPAGCMCAFGIKAPYFS